jgi:hypothetical protein
LSVKLREVLKAMRMRGENREANQCEFIIPLKLNIIHGFTYEKVLEMTMEEIEKWCNMEPKPAKYKDWNFWRGKEAFA